MRDLSFPRRRLFRALPLLLLLVMAASLCLGSAGLSLSELYQGLRDPHSAAYRILFYARLPRMLGGLLAGASLAVSGALLQNVLNNSLAGPNVIGVNAGAGLTVALCCAIAPTALQLVPLAAMAGAFLGVMTVLLIARRTGASKITLVLAGVAVSSIFSAGIDAVITFVPEALNGYSDFRIGGFSGVSMARILPAFWPALLSFALGLSLHNETDVLLLGKEQAQSLGLPAERLRVTLLGLAAVLAGSAVSVGGLVGFVGLIVPHIMRSLVGEESGPLLVSSALGGAALLGGCDLLGRMLFAPYEIPVGIVMSLAGGPFFIWLLQRRGRLHD